MDQDSWLPLAFLVAFLGFATGQEALLFMAALILTVVPVAQLWNRWALRHLSYTRTLSESRAFAGETVIMRIELANQKPLPLLWVRVDDRLPESMPPTGRTLLPSGLPRIGLLSHVTALLWYEKVHWQYTIPCKQRGFYFFGPAQVRSGDIFGLFESEAILEGTTRLIVYPQVQTLERLGLPAKNPFGGRRVNLPVFEDPTRVVGVRQYQPDDPMRRVHWKASARTQVLQVRVWEPTQEQQSVVLLNVATFEKHWQGVNRELLEWMISVAASICQHAFNEKSAVGLLANGSVPQSDQPIKVAPGRSPHQMRFILEALAAITSFATASIEKLLRAESPKLGWGATIVVVTAVVSGELQEQMIRLHRAGRQMALISLDNSFSEEDATRLGLQGVVVHRLPHSFTTREVRTGQPPAQEVVERWMLPEDYDPDEPFKPKKPAPIPLEGSPL
ncbi:MAG: DUF58 domain-containing protein [Ardenticatenales bacterium]|nr:DUF58 domain-containing protein [Ardenticatenales bacterium]